MVDCSVDLGTDLIDFVFSIEVSSHNIICLNKLIELSLQVLILLGKQEGVLLQSFQLGLEVKVAIHEGLI